MKEALSTATLATAGTVARGTQSCPSQVRVPPAHLEQLARSSATKLGERELAAIEDTLPVGFAHGHGISTCGRWDRNSTAEAGLPCRPQGTGKGTFSLSQAQKKGYERAKVTWRFSSLCAPASEI